MKGNIGATIKLLLYDLEIMGSNLGNILLQCKVRLRIIDSSLEPHNSGNFMHWATFFPKRWIKGLGRDAIGNLRHLKDQSTCYKI